MLNPTYNSLSESEFIETDVSTSLQKYHRNRNSIKTKTRDSFSSQESQEEVSVQTLNSSESIDTALSNYSSPHNNPALFPKSKNTSTDSNIIKEEMTASYSSYLVTVPEQDDQVSGYNDSHLEERSLFDNSYQGLRPYTFEGYSSPVYDASDSNGDFHNNLPQYRGNNYQAVAPDYGLAGAGGYPQARNRGQSHLPSNRYSHSFPQQSLNLSPQFGSDSFYSSGGYESGYRDDYYNYSSAHSISSTASWPPSAQQQAHLPQNRHAMNFKRNTMPIDGYIYKVQFKRAHRNFILAPNAPRDITPGDFVKVEADRGEDMGVVLAKIPVEAFEEVAPTAGYRGRGFSSGPGEKKFILRRSSLEERNLIPSKLYDEEIALQTIRMKSLERGLPMVILDAEYQFDRHKLTFFFEADKRIDFRDLVSELFSQYKTRIWMQQVDTSTLPARDPGMELARATGFLPDRDDDFSHVRETIAELDFKATLSRYSNDPSQSSTPRMARSSLDMYEKRPYNNMVFSDPWTPYRF